MAVSIDRVAPVAHLPLVLGVLRKLEIATLIDAFIPSHPDQDDDPTAQKNNPAMPKAP